MSFLNKIFGRQSTSETAKKIAEDRLLRKALEQDANQDRKAGDIARKEAADLRANRLANAQAIKARDAARSKALLAIKALKEEANKADSSSNALALAVSEEREDIWSLLENARYGSSASQASNPPKSSTTTSSTSSTTSSSTTTSTSSKSSGKTTQRKVEQDPAAKAYNALLSSKFDKAAADWALNVKDADKVIGILPEAKKERLENILKIAGICATHNFQKALWTKIAKAVQAEWATRTAAAADQNSSTSTDSSTSSTTTMVDPEEGSGSLVDDTDNSVGIEADRVTEEKPAAQGDIVVGEPDRAKALADNNLDTL